MVLAPTWATLTTTGREYQPTLPAVKKSATVSSATSLAVTFVRLFRRYHQANWTARVSNQLWCTYQMTNVACTGLVRHRKKPHPLQVFSLTYCFVIYFLRSGSYGSCRTCDLLRFDLWWELTAWCWKGFKWFLVNSCKFIKANEGMNNIVNK